MDRSFRLSDRLDHIWNKVGWTIDFDIKVVSILLAAAFRSPHTDREKKRHLPSIRDVVSQPRSINALTGVDRLAERRQSKTSSPASKLHLAPRLDMTEALSSSERKEPV